MQIWMIILAVFLALACLLGSLKVGARVVFGETIAAWIKIGPAMIQLYPVPEKKTQKKEKPAQKTSAKEKTKRNITFQAVWTLVEEVIPYVLNTLERVRKGIRIRVLNLHLTLSDYNPAVAAQRYGKVNSFLWPFLAAVENVVTVEHRDVRLDLDFASHKTTASGELFITMRLHHGFRMLMFDGIPMVRALLRFMKTTKPNHAQAAEENKSNKSKSVQKNADVA